MHYDYLFVGGGLSSGLCVLALLHRQPSLRIAIVERESELGGNHTWCFHAQDVPAEAHAWLSPLIVQCWPGYHVRFPRRARRLASPYACITSERLDRVVSEALRASHGRLLLNRCASRLEARRVVLEDGESLGARVVVDARGPTKDTDARSMGFQKFVGIEFAGRGPTGFQREPLLFDACVPQRDGFRFMYVLPFSGNRWLIEETFFSDNPSLDQQRSAERVLSYAAEKGFVVDAELRREHGVLPMPWRYDAPPCAPGVLVAGYRGGFFHPVTGYSLPIAARFASALAKSHERTATEADPLRRFVARQRDQQRFLFALTRMMFSMFEPERRFEVLEHFYRLPEAVIERFYAAELRATDRARLFLGAPPRGISLKRVLGIGKPQVAEQTP